MNQEQTAPGLLYLESFDSTRFPLTSIGRERAERTLHSEIELLLAWLFGGTMPVPEPYSADSTGFLDISDAVVTANPRDEIGKLAPFRLGVRSAPTRPDNPALHLGYLDVAALQFSSKMILTGWPSLQDDRAAREAVAGALAKRDIIQAQEVVSTDQERANLERMLRLDRYFGPEQRYAIQATPELLKQFTEGLRNFTPGILGPEVEVGAARLKQAVLDYESLDVDLSNRSDVRLAQEQYLQLPTADVTAYKDLIDFIDTAYNMVLRHSLGAGSSMYTSREFEQPGVSFVGEALARRIQQQIFASGGRGSFSEDPLVVFKPPILDATPEDESGQPLRVRWGAVWQLAQSGDFQDQLRAFRAAALRHQNAISGRHREALRRQAEIELEKHIRLIGKVAEPYIIEQDELSIRVLLELPRRYFKFSRDSALTTATGLGAGASVTVTVKLLEGGLGLAGMLGGAATALWSSLAGGLTVRDKEQRRLDGVVQQLRRHIRLR